MNTMYWVCQIIMLFFGLQHLRDIAAEAYCKKQYITSVMAVLFVLIYTIVIFSYQPTYK